jgi:hypothetical protein
MFGTCFPKVEDAKAIDAAVTELMARNSLLFMS